MKNYKIKLYNEDEDKVRWDDAFPTFHEAIEDALQYNINCDIDSPIEVASGIAPDGVRVWCIIDNVSDFNGLGIIITLEMLEDWDYIPDWWDEDLDCEVILTDKGGGKID